MLKDFIDQKLINLDAPIGSAMWESLKPVLMAEQEASVRKMVAVAAASMEPAGKSVVASVISPQTVADLASHGVALNDAAIWLRDKELVHAIRDKKDGRGAALPLDVWLNLTKYLDQATPYLDTLDQALIYAFDIPGELGKIVVRINYSSKVNRESLNSNFIRTGGLIEQQDLLEVLPKGNRRYVPLN